MKGNVIAVIVGIAIVAILIILNSALYVVDVRVQTIVTQFGNPVKTVATPGLETKIPVIQKVRYFDKRMLEWDGEPSDILTRDKENIVVDTWARWRIVDSLTFYTSLGSEGRGQGVLDEVIESATKNVVSSYPLREILRDSNRKLEYTTKELEDAELAKGISITKGRDKLEGEILQMASQGLTDKYGIELIDVRIKFINYVPAVIPKIYERMRSERIRIANRYESEGRREEAEILGSMRKELERIESEGYKEAKEIKGEADAKAVKIYAEAFKKAPEFYSFLKTMETYEKTFDKNTKLYLSTDGDYFRYLKSYEALEDRD